MPFFLHQYRMDFNASYIKALFKHCKSQHYVDTDGKLRPLPPAHPNNSSLRTPIPQQQQQPAIQQPTLSVQHLLQPAQTPPPYVSPTQSHQIPHNIPHHSQSAQPTHTVFDVLQQRRAQAELARAEAARTRLAALARPPANALQAGPNKVQEQFATTMANITAGVGSYVTNNAVPTTAPASATGTNPRVASTIASTGTHISEAQARALLAASGNSYPHSSALAAQFARHHQQAQQLHNLQNMQRLQQLQQLSQSVTPRSDAPPRSVSRPDSVPSAASIDPEVTRQCASVVSETAAVDAPIQASEMGSVQRTPAPTVLDGSEDIEVCAVPNGSARRLGGDLPIVNAVNNLVGNPRPTQSTGTSASSQVALMQDSVPPAASSMAAPNARPLSHHRSASAPMLGAVKKRPGHGAQVQRITTKTRCEATAQVRKVAERSQRLMFKGTHLYFADAAFQVPSSEEEAIDIMRKGTYDVDKEIKEASNDLYYVSWSHTQFFSAQMAALGYRFVSSNLRRSLKQSSPPPVSTWLRLEKYHTVPRPLPTTGAPSAGEIRVASTLPSNVQSSRSNQGATSTVQVPSATTPTPVISSASAGSSAAQERVVSPPSTAMKNMRLALEAATLKGTHDEMRRRGAQNTNESIAESNGYATGMTSTPLGATAPKKQSSKTKEIPIIDLTL